MTFNMFQDFRPGAFRPAWVGGSIESPFFASQRPPEQPGHHGGQGWGEKPRRRRGDIKFILLGLIAERPQHGYDLIKELENRRGGFRRLSPGSVYPTLQMLEEGGYLTSQQLDDKKIYTITESGQTLLQAHLQQLGDAPSGDPSSVEQSVELMALRRSLMMLNDAVAQVAQGGNLEQIKQVSDRLEKTKREIFALLAGG